MNVTMTMEEYEALKNSRTDAEKDIALIDRQRKELQRSIAIYSSQMDDPIARNNKVTLTVPSNKVNDLMLLVGLPTVNTDLSEVSDMKIHFTLTPKVE